VTEPLTDSELAQHFRNSAVSAMPRAPLNAAIARIVAEDPDLRGLLLHAPRPQQLPVLLLASVHATLLELVDDAVHHDLVYWYPNLTEAARAADDRRLASVFRDFVTRHRGRIVDLVRTRHTQTNEVGRSALLLVALGLVAADIGESAEIAHLDVGASGGLNLLIDRLAYRYVPDAGPREEIRASRGDAEAAVVGGPSTVELVVHTRGPVPVPTAIPRIAARCGIDRHPVDITDDDEARWLEACVWPDQTDRFERLKATIEMARENPPELLAGDAVESLDPAVERMARSGHVVITNSWALNYLPADERVRYAAELDRLGSEVDLSWVFLESPGLTPELPWGAAPLDSALTGLNLVRWRDGSRNVEHLARCHPHGYWMHWAG
jgi:hypothetical protein